MQIGPDRWAASPAARLLRANVCVLAIALLVFPHSGQSQTAQLTPEQQRLLSQLPPAQRDAALRQLGNLQDAAATANDATAVPTIVVKPESTATDDEPEGPPEFGPGDTVVLDLSIRDAATDGVIADSDPSVLLRSRLLAGNPYTLDSLGRIRLPGVGAIGLAGLTEQQAALRLNSDPALANFVAKATRLPLTPMGIEALKPFGYELFGGGTDYFSANSALPVAADYVVGIGDTVRIQLFGNQNADYELPIDRNGAIHFPEIGPISVAGMSYVGVQELIAQRVSEQIIGTQVSVTLGELRALQIFVVGDVNNPGSYTVSPMATITTALARSGGIATHGSMRRVQLKRGGSLVGTLDVYDLLLRGDTRGDARLRAGDVVFVPPVGTRVTVTGAVNRPAIYEYKGAANVADVIGLSGGLTANAYEPGVKIERLEPGVGLSIIDADQTSTTGQDIKISDGDTLIVPAGVEQLEGAITLVGNVQRPGDYQWRSGLRISDLISSSRDLLESSDVNYLLIRREVVPNTEIAVLSADIEAAWRDRGGESDVLLQARDTVHVFDLNVGRNHVVEPLVAELQLRSTHGNPLAAARVGGSVNAPGAYPIEAGMTVSDLIRAAGGLAESAFLGEAELSRFEVTNGEARETQLLTVNLQRALTGDSQADIGIQPLDFLQIKEIPRWREQEFVEISGEVMFAGRYPIRQGETLTSVIARAGGLTSLAFADGAVFTRESLQRQERDQLAVLANRIESDLASMSISDPSQTEAVGTGQSLLNQLRNTTPVGRLVIDLSGVIAGNSDDVMLRGGDVIRIPTAPQEVTVIGEVQYATSHLYRNGASMDDYINSSGGTTRRADVRQIYVVRANGEVVVRGRSRFFSRSSGPLIHTGDTIVVPLHTERLKTITLWTNVTQIIYQMAIAAAAVNSF